MKFIGRWLFRLAVIALLLAIAGLLFKDTLLKEALESRLRRLTGLDVQIGSVEADLLAPVVRLENLRVYAPAEFGGGPLVIAPLVHAEYRRGESLRGMLVMPLLRMQIAELVLVDAGGGRTSLSDLQERLARAAARPAEGWLELGGVEALNLTVDRIRLRNLSAPERELVIDPGIRGVVVRNLRTVKNLNLLLSQIAQRAAPTARPAPHH